MAGRAVVRKLLVIGIGAGDPEHVTAQAIRALNEVDVFFVVEKGEEKHDLVDLRRVICERYIERPGYRTVELRDPERDRSAAAYGLAVEDWRHARALLYAEAIGRELAPGECGAFMVWGDPALYDSTLAIVEEILADDPDAFAYEVVPGISSVQALAARHRIALNRIGGAIRITTGRRLSEGLHDGEGDVVVVLDAGCAFRRFAGEPMDIYWGAYVGTEDEILIAGPVAEVMDEIQRVRAEARERKGWIMDTYLLRRRS
jgi:precorrin-6A synthase